MEPLRFPDNKRTTRSRALALIKERSLFRGEITFASGRKSDFYFDLKPSMLNAEGAYLLAELILDRLSTIEVDYVGGLAVGAVPLISPINVLSHSRQRPIQGFFVRKEIKDHGTRRKIDGLAAGESREKKRVAILEDVTTTGGSSMLSVEAARQAGAEIVMVLAVIDREEGAAKFYAEQGIRFEAIFPARDFFIET